MSPLRLPRCLAAALSASIMAVVLAGCAVAPDTSLMSWADPSQAKTWKPIGGKGAYGIVYSTSLGFRADGSPVAAIKDYDGVSGLSYATVLLSSGGTWTPLGNTRFSAANPDFITLGIDRVGTTYVAYCDPSNGVYVLKLAGSIWTMVGPGPISTGLASDLALAFDLSNNLYVAYADGDQSWRASVQEWNGSTWISVGTPGFTPDSAGELSMGISASGRIFLAYQDFNTGGNELSASQFENGTWSQLGPRGFSQTAVADVSLAMDPTGVPCVGFAEYQGALTGSKASVMKLSGAGWSYAGNRAFSPDQASDVRLGIDKWGTAYVAFSDQSMGNKASAMVLDGSTWTQLGTTGFSDGTFAYSSISVSPDGVPAYAYQDQANGGNLTTMEYN